MPNYAIPNLKEWHARAIVPSPLQPSAPSDFVADDERVAAQVIVRPDLPQPDLYLRAGPRAEIVFRPEECRAAIVTCGGLCPGLNNVIRDLVMCLNFNYGVTEVWGIRYGYRGFCEPKYQPVPLRPEVVDSIHHQGGTILGTSRGGFDLQAIVDSLVAKQINLVFVIGGDGTQRGALKIHEEIRRRGLKMVVAGIPKTIDNDILLIDKSFGFDTAVAMAGEAIHSVHVEATCMPNGVGLVKLMGRQSGFIAMHATLSNREANICLIPEVPFVLQGPHGLFTYLERRLEQRGHTVIVMAEGAGLDLVEKSSAKDPSGNPVLPEMGLWLKEQITHHFRDRHVEINMKYIDPSYMIRTVPAIASDSLYCSLLAQNAVHGAMAGFSGFVVGQVHGEQVYLPATAIVEATRRVDPSGPLWRRVLETTGQPEFVR